MSDLNPAEPASEASRTDTTITALNRLFLQALLLVGKHGDIEDLDAACRLAANGWSLLRHDWPRDAERLNGVMHSLTGPKRTTQPQKSVNTPANATIVLTHPVTERK